MIKMEQKRRIKGVNETDEKEVKGKAVIGIAMAAVILASVFAATVPIVSAESRGDNFNHIVVEPTPQKVLIGQNLEFEGFDTIETVSRIVSGDIENVYQADANNRIYNVNWPTSGAYYVNYDYARKDYEAQLSVEEPDMPLKLKVGTKEVSSIALGTKLTIDTGGMNLFPEDQIDLVIKGPDGQVKYDDVNAQQFTDITVADLNDWYGDNNLETTGWTIGDYTFKVETDDVNACGLEAESVVRPLQILKGEIVIEADMTSAVELETVKLIVTGVAGDEIHVAASPLSDDVVFKAGIDDTPMDTTNQFNHIIDADGTRKYAVEFTDTGSYTIEVTVTGPAEIGGIPAPRVGDTDTVDITVSEKLVTFDVPPTVTIGENFTIRGTANIGSIVDIAVDDYVYPLLNDLAIDDNGEFSVEIATAEMAPFSDPGPVMLTAYIDKAAGAGDAIETSDGTVKLFMQNEAGGGIAISASGTSVGKNETIILAISAVPNHNVSVTTSDPAHTVFEYNRYDFTGTSSNSINIAPSDTISIPSDVGDCDSHTTAKNINGVWNTMDAAGILKFAVHFTDLGTYKITATDYGTGHPTATRLDAESVNITVTAKNVSFDLPSVVVIGDKITIKGTVDTGTYVSVYVDDVLYRKLQNLVIADGEFRQEVKTTEVGMGVPGIVELKAYIDCDKMCGDPHPTTSDDGTTEIFMVEPWLTASLAPDSVDPEDDFTVSGSAPGSTEVVIVSVPPLGGGGKSLLDKGMMGLSPRKATVSTTDANYIKKMTVQEDADSGIYYVIVLSSGMDGYWGMTGEYDLDAAFEKKYGIRDLSGPSIATKTQNEIVAILGDLTQSVGSDDIMRMLPLKVGATDALILNPIADVVVGNQLNVSGETSGKDGSMIWLTVKSEDQMIDMVTTIAMDNAFNVTFDTIGLLPGTYTVRAYDEYGYTVATSVNIVAKTPAS
uniref:Uncharacterized protein n=1 Tax=Candidatus Methanophaga sp. ANME-1 ERB7 TaxID=2759913 RepID=A0A7G9Z803_9EURY|nr:hypothetical protein JCABFCCD_00028 [Methanosarcinales archaeon ANME-1 ERB7]